MRHADDPNYCRVIVRIREKTRERVMELLAASKQVNLSSLVEELLSEWLAKRPASGKTKRAAK